MFFLISPWLCSLTPRDLKDIYSVNGEQVLLGLHLQAILTRRLSATTSGTFDTEAAAKVEAIVVAGSY